MFALSETIGGIAHAYAYTYDLASRLTEVRQDGALTARYTYDANGNRLSRTDGGGTTHATYDVQDRLEQFGPTTYVHSPNGERQSETTADNLEIWVTEVAATFLLYSTRRPRGSGGPNPSARVPAFAGTTISPYWTRRFSEQCS